LLSLVESKLFQLDHGGIGLGSNFGKLREIWNEIKLNKA
jgi:hypothetical protein